MKRQPSLWQLRAIERRQAIELHRPGLERRASKYGVRFTEKTDTFVLARRVHSYEDELRRPELEARAERLGVPTHWGWGPFKVARGITDLSLACFDEEERLRLTRRLGVL